MFANNQRSRRKPRQKRKTALRQPVPLSQFDRELLSIEKQQMVRPRPTLEDFAIRTPKTDKRVHNFYLAASRGSITTSTTLPSAGAITFILQDLPAFSDITNLFDQYRILSVRVEFVMGGATNPLTGPPGIMATALDYDDANTPASLNELVQYETCQVVPIGQYFERTVKPRSALAAYSGVFTSFANVYGQWYDAVSSSVQHYGIKYYIPAVPTSVYTIQPIAHYHIQCRSTH
jgi:hypothetical protein